MVPEYEVYDQRRLPIPILYRALFVCIRSDQAGINCKSFRTNRPLSEAAFHYRLEHMPQDVTLPEPAMGFFEKLDWSGTLPSRPRRQNQR